MCSWSMLVTCKVNISRMGFCSLRGTESHRAIGRDVKSRKGKANHTLGILNEVLQVLHTSSWHIISTKTIILLEGVKPCLFSLPLFLFFPLSFLLLLLTYYPCLSLASLYPYLLLCQLLAMHTLLYPDFYLSPFKKFIFLYPKSTFLIYTSLGLL